MVFDAINSPKLEQLSQVQRQKKILVVNQVAKYHHPLKKKKLVSYSRYVAPGADWPLDIIRLPRRLFPLGLEAHQSLRGRRIDAFTYRLT